MKSSPLGIIGGGQLARMMIGEAQTLGLDCIVLDPSNEACAATPATEFLCAPYDDIHALQHLAQRCQVLTFDFENVPAAALRALGECTPIYPHPDALDVAQDRMSEKRLFAQLDIPAAPWRAIDDRANLEYALRDIGYPAILKTRRLGYDGKGQWRLYAETDLDALWRDAAPNGPLLLEGHIEFECEVSLIAVRGRDGTHVFYPLVENRHRDGILRSTHAPFAHAALTELAQQYAARLLDALNYVGVLAIEFFVAQQQLLANEIAPRVHNSGHWTLEGAHTSQFANHLRAILGLPLGLADCRTPSTMFNCIGHLPAAKDVLALPSVHLHDYAKSPRSGRKVGHITVCDAHTERHLKTCAQVQTLVEATSH